MKQWLFALKMALAVLVENTSNQRLKPEIQIIGTGGVLTGRDAFEHILCGASMVQIGTTLHKEGVSAFERITAELKAIMEDKGYASLEDFRGKLHYID